MLSDSSASELLPQTLRKSDSESTNEKNVMLFVGEGAKMKSKVTTENNPNNTKHYG